MNELYNRYKRPGGMTHPGGLAIQSFGMWQWSAPALILMWRLRPREAGAAAELAATRKMLSISTYRTSTPSIYRSW